MGLRVGMSRLGGSDQTAELFLRRGANEMVGTYRSRLKALRIDQG